ncbi:Sialidase precursor [Planctomycetes bacterium Pan216]|uniref:Sialidase n=1 Tax=Kolteria novifilia TaxID=2527975 RepID=A0A518AZL1_9BACT|nr:Sialidase precursor [Planctomycetes bacterium Pan216]
MNEPSRGPISRRSFCRATSATLTTSLLTLPRGPVVASPGDAPSRLLTPIDERTVCPWTPKHPRHDHQLYFPLSGDRLLFAWCEYYADRPSLLERRPTSRDGSFRDDMPCRISGMISHDRGRTWNSGFTLQENRWNLNVKHPNLIRLPSGEILFFFVAWDSGRGQRNVFMKRSKDEGESWSEIEQVSEPGWYCNVAGRALTMKSGRIALPTHGPRGAGDYRGKDLESFVYYSDDGFATWKRGQAVTAPGRGAHEPTLIELADGRLYCLLRTTLKRQYVTLSDDGGASWSTPEPTELASPDSPAVLARIPSTGDLLVLWNNVASPSNWPRTPLTAALSRDEGASWTIVGDIDNRRTHDAAYPSVHVQGDELLVAYYTRPTKWARDCEIMQKIYAIDELYRTA